MNDVQTKEFNVLMEIIKILKKHNLVYFAIGGTCIGAIRHNGFIPWDDDIDIAMPRSGYELFKNEYYKELPEPYKKLDYNDNKYFNRPYIKIHDSSTTLIEACAKDYPERYTGAFVDIMPIDGFPVDLNKQKHLLKKMHRFAKLNWFVRPYIHYQNPQKLINRMKKMLKLHMPKIHKFDYYINKIKDELSKYDFDNSQEVFFTWRILSPIPEKRKIYDKEIFDSVIEVPFESGLINVPYRYDDYLTQDFGDYMKMPPEEKRGSNHDLYISDMDKPYEFYIEKFSNNEKIGDFSGD